MRRSVHGLYRRRFRMAVRLHQGLLAGRQSALPAFAPHGRRHRRRRRRAGLSAEYPVPLFCHRASGRFRLHGARCIRNGRRHAQVRASGTFFRSAGPRFRMHRPGDHGNPLHRIGTGPQDNHHGTASDELRSAPADLCADHSGIFRREISGIHHVADLPYRRHDRADRRTHHEIDAKARAKST